MSTTLLRDLTDEEFLDRYDCDRFTASVLAQQGRMDGFLTAVQDA